jgi:hypothetical protein
MCHAVQEVKSAAIMMYPWVIEFYPLFYELYKKHGMDVRLFLLFGCWLAQENATYWTLLSS